MGQFSYYRKSTINKDIPILKVVYLFKILASISVPPVEAFKEEAHALIRLQGVKTTLEDTSTTNESTDDTYGEDTDYTNQ